MTSSCITDRGARGLGVTSGPIGDAMPTTIAQAAALKDQKAMALLDKKRAKEEEKRKKKVRGVAERS